MSTSPTRYAAALEAQIIRILRCPATGSPLTQRGEELIAVDDERLRYPIQHGVPRLLTETAESEGRS